MRYPKIAVAMTTAALTLSLGLVGCGSSDNSNDTQTATTTEEQQAATESADDYALDETEKGMNRYGSWYLWYDDYAVDMRVWNYAFAGNTDDGKTVYYAQDDDNDEAMIFILNNDGTYTCYAGRQLNPQSNVVTIIDEYSGHSIDVVINRNNYGDNIYVTVGDVSCELVRADINDVINSIDIIEADNYDQRYF